MLLRDLGRRDLGLTVMRTGGCMHPIVELMAATDPSFEPRISIFHCIMDRAYGGFGCDKILRPEGEGGNFNEALYEKFVVNGRKFFVHTGWMQTELPLQYIRRV
jgi:hypothetical protein